MKIGSGALMLSNLVPDEDRIGGLGFLLPDLADNLDMWLALFAPFLSVAYPARCPARTYCYCSPLSRPLQSLRAEDDHGDGSGRSYYQ